MLLNLYLGHSNEPISYDSPVTVPCEIYTTVDVLGKKMCVFATDDGDLKCEAKCNIQEIRLNGNHRLTKPEAVALQNICQDFDEILIL